MDIALVGAGIGGLTAAACLLRNGHRVRIYEQAGHVSEVGAAVQMSANAVDGQCRRRTGGRAARAQFVDERRKFAAFVIPDDHPPGLEPVGEASGNGFV